MKSSVRRRIKPYLDVFNEFGCQLMDIESTGSCHHKIYVAKGPDQRFFIAPFSGSDHRGLKNFRSDVRKWVMELDENPQATG